MNQHHKEALIRLFYPADCAVCQKALTLDERILCAACAEDLATLAWPLEDTLVDERFEYLDHVWAVYAYRSPLKELLHGIKYHRKDYLLKACAPKTIALAQAVTSDHWYDAILPVPIHKLKLMQRHFNQSGILADLLAPWLTPPVLRSLLVKKYFVPSQTFLSQEERSINIYGAFKVRNPSRVPGRSFLLIDDVFTTGATANEAARALKAFGAKHVSLLALARTTAPSEKPLRFPAHADKIPDAQSYGMQ